MPVAVPGPVDEQGLALDQFHVQRAPVAAVHTVVAVVPHHEDGLRRHHVGIGHAVPRPVVVAGIPHVVRLVLLGPGRRTALRVGPRGDAAVVAVGIPQVRLVDFSVDVDHALTHGHRIAGHGHATLDVVLVPVPRVLEDDDVALARLADGRQLQHGQTVDHGPVDQRYADPVRRLGAVQELVHEQEITDLQRLEHGTGGNGEGLENELPQYQGDKDRRADGLDVVDEGLAGGAPHRLGLGGLRRRLVRPLAPKGPVDGFPVHRSTFSTARNASCGISTLPTCFMRFLPSFCFSSSLRLRDMSPP